MSKQKPSKTVSSLLRPIALRTNKQAGLALIWVLMTGLALLSIVALAIDLARRQIISRHIQNAADAAALAGVNQLNGTIQGWQSAKRAAIATLRQQNIMGSGGVLSQSLEFISEGEIDQLEPELSKYRSTKTTVGNLNIEIKRGIYFAKTGSFAFESLEGRPLEAVRKPVEGFYRIPFKYNFPVHQLANSIQVSITMNNVKTMLADVMGIFDSGPLTRQAVALSNAQLEEIAAPFAIPACGLLLDQDPYEAAKYESTSYQASQQCRRELVFTEANPRGEYRSQRLQGLIRADSYPRPPSFAYGGGESICGAKLLGEGPNCKAIPIRGVLGIASAVPSDEPATPQEVRAAFNQMAASCSAESCGMKVALGSRFRPLHNAVGINGLYTDQVAALEMQLQKLIQSSSVKFLDVFNPWDPDSNFPHLYQPRDSGIITYGDLINLEMGRRHSVEDFQNPLCQSDLLNFRPGPNGLEPVPLNQRTVRKLKAMVIAPGDGDTAYCDYDALFNFEPMDSEAPTAETEPIVLGFVDVYVFDFGIRRLQDSSLRNDVNPQRLHTLNLMNPLRTFIEDHSDWMKCMETKCGVPGAPPPPQCHEHDCERPQGSGTTIISREWWDKTAQCYELPDYDDLYSCLNPPSNPIELIKWFFGHFLPVCIPIWQRQITDGWGTLTAEAIRNNWKCFPEPVKDCDDPTNWKCWQPPQHLAPQFGCGALRARVDCHGDRLTTTIKSSQTRPVLVK